MTLAYISLLPLHITFLVLSMLILHWKFVAFSLIYLKHLIEVSIMVSFIKLKSHGIDGNLFTLIKSFLNKRCQGVVLNGQSSD